MGLTENVTEANRYFIDSEKLMDNGYYMTALSGFCRAAILYAEVHERSFHICNGLAGICLHKAYPGERKFAMDILRNALIGMRDMGYKGTLYDKIATYDFNLRIHLI